MVGVVLVTKRTADGYTQHVAPGSVQDTVGADTADAAGADTRDIAVMARAITGTAAALAHAFIRFFFPPAGIVVGILCSSPVIGLPFRSGPPPRWSDERILASGAEAPLKPR
jgi:hypothetical protein